MKEYTNGNPLFQEKVSILETTDTNHADNFNASTMILMDNTLALYNLYNEGVQHIESKFSEVNQEITAQASISKAVLAAGETTVTIADSRITTDSALSFYTSIYGTNPTAVSVATGSVTLTFDAQAKAMEVGVRVDA